MGLPLLASTDAAILPAGVAEFAKDLDVPEDEVRMYLAVREAATERLYARVPWLRGAVLGAVETYSREISVDTAGIEEAVSGIDPTDSPGCAGRTKRFRHVHHRLPSAGGGPRKAANFAGSY